MSAYSVRAPSKEVKVRGLFDYVPTIEGWRGVAVLGVVFFHLATNKALSPGLISRVAVKGYFGVDIFFAISGFLICGKLIQEMQDRGTFSLKSFYVRRCFRIFPAVWIYLLTLSLLTAIGWLDTRKWEFVSTLAFVRNYFPLFHGSVLGTYTAQLWSLSLEEQFYLLWAVTLFLIGPRVGRIGWIALVLALAVFVWRVFDSSLGWFIPYGTDIGAKTDTRIDALLWGCLAAVAYPFLDAHANRFKLKFAPWIVVALVLVTLDIKIVEFSLIRAILFPAMILVTAMSPDSVIGRILEFPAIRWIGRISYSIYIWQQLLIFPARLHSPLLVVQKFPYNVVLILILSSLSYYFIELPAIRMGRRVGQRVKASAQGSEELVAIPSYSARASRAV